MDSEKVLDLPASQLRWIIVGLGLCYILVVLDIAGVPVLLPSLAKSLHLSSTEVLWVMNAYNLALAVLVIFFGRLADRIGLKVVYLLGAAIFVLGSLVCAMANTFNTEVIGRVIQGVGGAAVFPLGLAMLPKMVVAKQVTRYMGYLLGINATTYALSGLVAGLFSQYVTWRLFFYVNIPVGLVAIALLWFKLPRFARNSEQKIDIFGTIFSALFVLAIIIGLLEGRNHGYERVFVYRWFIIAVASLIVFFVVEHFVREKLIEYSIFRQPNMPGLLLMTVFFQGAIFSLAFIMIFLQRSLHLSPSYTGYITMAVGLPSIIISIYAGKLAEWIAPRYLLRLGFLVFSAGYFWIAIEVSAGIYSIIPAMVLLGFGFPLVMINSMTLCFLSTEKKYHGVISGLVYAVRYVGGVIIFSIVGLLFYSGSTGSVAIKVISNHAMQLAMYTTMGVAVIGLLIGFLAVRKPIT